MLLKKKRVKEEKKSYTVTRKITIDAGHRVHTHGSKCFHLHGHTYTIEATAIAEELIKDGVQKDMVIDFGFLKKGMMELIDRCCDHGLILDIKDPFVEQFLNEKTDFGIVEKMVEEKGFYFQPPLNDPLFQQKLYIINTVPTAERLAEHWFNRLDPFVRYESKNVARMHRIVVWETPNCRASYPF